MRYIFLLIAFFALIMNNHASFAQEQDFQYSDGDKRDPFLPLVDENGRYIFDEYENYTFNDLNLIGILWDPEGNSSALINDEIVRKGESIYGFLVKEIKKDSVTVAQDGQEYTMWLTVEKEGQ